MRSPNVNREFNFGQHIKGMKNTEVFTAREVMVPFKCDVHGWMTSYGGILDHPYFAVTSDGGKFELQEPSSRHLHGRGVAREDAPSDADGDGRRKGKQGSQLHVQVMKWLHRYALLVVCSTVAPDRRWRYGDQHGFGPCGARLAEHVRLVHVLVSVRPDGRRHLLRARPPADREHRRLSHDHPCGVDLAGRSTAVDAEAWCRGAGRGHPPGPARWIDRPAASAGASVDRPCWPGAAFLLRNDCHRRLHFSGLAEVHRRHSDDPRLRSMALIDDGRDLCPDPARRDDAA